MPTDHSIFDDAAFEQLFKERFAPLCAWCRYKFGFDLAITKDIVHTAFIQLWKHRRSLLNAGAAHSYLHRSVINRSLDVLKQQRIKTRYTVYALQQEELTRHLDQFDVKRLQNDIDKAVAELPDQMRRIFQLSRYEGLSYRDIAQELNISVNTVETQMSRALAKLRVKLAGWLEIFFWGLSWYAFT